MEKTPICLLYLGTIYQGIDMDENDAFAIFLYSIAFFFFSIPIAFLILGLGELYMR